MSTNVEPPWMRDMRRKDRQISDPTEIRSILGGAIVCRVAMCDGLRPYVVPMNFGLQGNRLYLHCAKEGKKLDLIRANPHVCFEVEGRVALIPGDEACAWSTRYESVIGYGTAAVVEDMDERLIGVRALLQQVGGDPVSTPVELPADVVIVRIEIEALSGKTSFSRDA